jgi:hypothetical protein
MSQKPQTGSLVLRLGNTIEPGLLKAQKTALLLVVSLLTAAMLLSNRSQAAQLWVNKSSNASTAQSTRLVVFEAFMRPA